MYSMFFLPYIYTSIYTCIKTPTYQHTNAPYKYIDPHISWSYYVSSRRAVFRASVANLAMLSCILPGAGSPCVADGGRLA